MRKNADELYASVRAVVERCVCRYLRTYGGDPDEALSRGHDGFLNAIRTWKEGGASFEKWVAYRVWGALKEKRRAEPDFDPDFDLSKLEARKPRHLDACLPLLSDDGGEAVAVVLSLPPLPGKKWPAERKRRLVHRTLASYGWGPLRINRAFKELEEALC